MTKHCTFVLCIEQKYYILLDLSTDTYSGLEGSHAKTYDIPPLTERQIQANSKFKRVSEKCYLYDYL